MGVISMPKLDHVIIRVKPKQITAFYPLLTAGFRMTTWLSISVQDLLCGLLDLDEDYVEKKIQTVFLNGKAVDNLKKTVIRDGATLALSAAMPGLVGATFRRGGLYSVMREQITHPADYYAINEAGKGMVTIKFFNLIARDIGPRILGRGIQVSGKQLQQLLSSKGARPCEDITEEILLNSRQVTCQEIGAFDFEGCAIHLKIFCPPDLEDI